MQNARSLWLLVATLVLSGLVVFLVATTGRSLGAEPAWMWFSLQLAPGLAWGAAGLLMCTQAGGNAPAAAPR